MRLTACANAPVNAPVPGVTWTVTINNANIFSYNPRGMMTQVITLLINVN